MTQFNLIQRPDLADRLVRSLKIAERNPAPTLAPEITPVVIAEDLSVQSPYLSPLRRRASGGDTVAAVAAQRSQGQLKNPAGSGVIAVVRSLLVASGATDECQWGYRDFVFGVDLPGASTRFWKDLRLSGDALTGFPTCIVLSGTAVANMVNPVLSRARIGTANNQLYTNLEIVVPPGFAFGVSLQTVFLQLTFSIEWDEYTS